MSGAPPGWWLFAGALGVASTLGCGDTSGAVARGGGAAGAGTTGTAGGATSEGGASGRGTGAHGGAAAGGGDAGNSASGAAVGVAGAGSGATGGSSGGVFSGGGVAASAGSLAGATAAAGRAGGAAGDAAGGAGGVSNAGGGAGTGSAGAPATFVLDDDSLAVRFADAILARSPDPLALTSGTTFEYNHGIVLRGIEQVYRYTQQKKYLDYIQRYVDDFVSAKGDISIASGYSLDNIEPAVLLPFLYAETGDAKYATAAAQVRALYDGFPKNEAGGFWHKQTYPNQMWLDSIYMGAPFLAEYGSVIGTCGSFCADTVVLQSSLIAEHVQDAASGLLRHAWDDSSGTKAAWADATTGVSPEVWGRALGWYVMSLVDNLPLLPASTSGRSELVTRLQKAAAGIEQNQDSASGLWYQVVDKGDRSDDFLETSGSGMFVYALQAGVRRGLLDGHFADVAAKGYGGLKTKVTSDGQNRPSITGAVHGMVVQNDYAGYIDQLPLLTDSPHGLCAILLAASEMESHAP